jgi:hypothetical protein
MLNVFIRYQHFKMENFSSLVGLLQHQDWMCEIDLKDAFFCVKICPTHRKFLRFIWQGKMMQFCSLPFGLASAPRTFTKVLKPVMALLRRVGLKVVIYLDDLLLMNQSQQGLVKDRDSVLWLLESLGFVINHKKSFLVPSQKMEYLGFLVDSRAMSFSLPEDKILKIQASCKEVLSDKHLTVRVLAQLLGQLNACAAAVLPAPLHFRQLQMLKTRALIQGQSYEAPVNLSPECREELRWWIHHLEIWNGKGMITPGPDSYLRCIKARLGSYVGATESPGLVEPTGEIIAHKCTGTDGSKLCSPVLCKKS